MIYMSNKLSEISLHKQIQIKVSENYDFLGKFLFSRWTNCILNV